MLLHVQAHPKVRQSNVLNNVCMFVVLNLCCQLRLFIRIELHTFLNTFSASCNFQMCVDVNGYDSIIAIYADFQP